MNRIKDYASFATWFAGLGYIVLWPLAAPVASRPFGASIFCRDNSLSVLDFLCNSAHLLSLPPGLHVVGFVAAVFVTVRLLVFAVQRSRCTTGGDAAEASAAATQSRSVAAPFVMPQPSRRKAPPPRRGVKPRAHFGLRGMPQ